MKLKDSLRRALVHARHVSEDLLKAFHSPQDWTRQVCPGANHALWFAGHMGVVDNYFIAAIDPGKARKMPGYEEKFSRAPRHLSESEVSR